MDKNTKNMIGKTIKSIKKQAINCWRIDFTDGTHKFIWSELHGSFGLTEILVSDEE